MMDSLWKHIKNHIEEVSNQHFASSSIEPICGGDSHYAYKVTSSHSGEALFVKINKRSAYPMFIAEAQNLAALADTHSIRTPKFICYGEAEGSSYLVLEYLALLPDGDDYLLGQQLAALHQSPIKLDNSLFGFRHNNYIGLTEQVNTWANDWCTFWIEQRLLPQINLAYQNGFRSHLEVLEKPLIEAAQGILSKHHPDAVLVHGDLWGGNKGFVNELPVVFDLACYYADREVDIAMTELFGGFSARFYRGYNNSWPLKEGYEQRKALYNLYHILNHLNLFGAGYLQQTIQMMHQIRSATPIN